MKSFDEKPLKTGTAGVEPAVTERPAITEQDVADRPVVGGLAFLESTPRRTGIGLPNDLRAGIEQLSGMSMDGVTVHHNSALPAQVGALACTRGSDIHLGPGQQEHLAHEAWHVVQQAQGRVRPTLQLKGRQAVNDDHGLEHEADVMGAKALRWRPGGANLLIGSQLRTRRAVSLTAPLQLVQIIVKTGIGTDYGTLSVKPDTYRLTRRDKLATNAQILAYKGTDKDILARKAELEQAAQVAEQERAAEELERVRLAAEKKLASDARKKVRGERRSAAVKTQMPKIASIEQEFQFPVVVEGEGQVANLVYRGMSVNNVNNMLKKKDFIFKAEKPTGKASLIEHIVDDSRESPYLSFETGGLGISAGKYAAKPVDEFGHPLEVTKESTGFLKQKKSYSVAMKNKYADNKWIGYVGGIPKTDSHVDVSTPDKAEALMPHAKGRIKAIGRAVTDKEILVKPGEGGIGAGGLPFVAKVKVVDEGYFKKNLIHQTPQVALGFYRAYDSATPVYSKIQVAKGAFTFNIDPGMLRNDEDSESEMSDIEEMNMNAEAFG